MAPNVCRKIHDDIFFGGHAKKGLHNHFGIKFLGKSRTKLFGQVWGNSGKNPLHPKNMPAPTTMLGKKTHLG